MCVCVCLISLQCPSICAYRSDLTRVFSSTSSSKTDKLEVRHNWQIIAIASCVIIAVTLAVGIYNAVIYQNIQTALFLTTTSDTTTTITTITTTRAAVAAATTSDSTTSSSTTTALTSVALATTSPAAVSTDVVTTKTPPICPSMLPFGDDAGDETFTSIINMMPFPPFNLWNKKFDKGTLTVVSIGKYKYVIWCKLQLRCNFPCLFDLL